MFFRIGGSPDSYPTISSATSSFLHSFQRLEIGGNPGSAGPFDNRQVSYVLNLYAQLDFLQVLSTALRTRAVPSNCSLHFVLRKRRAVEAPEVLGR